MSAVISDCTLFRYRLDRSVAKAGRVFAYFGVNGATAGVAEDDHTVRKWIGFTARNDGSRFIVGNPFAFRAKDVRQLAKAADPIGPENDRYLAEIIAEADVLVPCWGNRTKVPNHLRYRFSQLTEMLIAAGKPMLHFGLTGSGDPKHPLTLGWSTPMTPWEVPDARP